MKTALLITAGGALALLALGSCAEIPAPASETEVAVHGASFFSHEIPHDIPRQPPSPAYDEAIASWAWQHFIGLGWKATYDAESGNFQRGIADTTWSPDQGTPDTVVWETYAHRSELRPWKVALTAPFDSEPNYLTGVRASGNLLQGKDQSGNPASLTLLNNLDEDSEIGSASIYAGPVDDPATTPLILYQAKTNRDEYDYIKSVFGDKQHESSGTLAIAAGKNKQNIKDYKAYFKDAAGNPVYDICQTPENIKPQDAITLPCGETGGREGAIEIKTAFMRVPPGQEEDFTNFFVREAIYYTEGLNADGTGNGVFTYHNANFALIGMHIIHKTKNYPGFVFASFEHNDLESMGFSYALLSPAPPDYGSFNIHGASVPAGAPDGTQFGDLIPIKRQDGSVPPTSNGDLYPVSQEIETVNAGYQSSLAAANSIWANYRLIGVQAQQTTSYAPVADGLAGPNHFMANFVIESDAFLGNFFGPGFSSTNAVFPTGPTFPDGSQNGDNSLYQGKSFNMGGCKGCHGVAATAFGTDTSFLLDFVGKPVNEPDTIFYVKPKPGQ